MAIRDDVEALIALLKTHKENTSQEYFYEIRSLDRDAEAFAALSPVEKAARLIYLNKTCFNGLYRVNLQGLFNVPYGRYKNPAIFDEESLRAVSRYLNGNDVDILTGDFAAAVEGADGESFVYFDPPYHSKDNTNFTGYQAGGFGEKRADPAARRLRRAERTGRQVPAQQRGYAFHPGAVPRLYDQNGHGQPGNQRQRQRAGAGQRGSD